MEYKCDQGAICFFCKGQCCEQNSLFKEVCSSISKLTKNINLDAFDRICVSDQIKQEKYMYKVMCSFPPLLFIWK